ncbi:MAG: HNH endonuclease [Opitutales bacterium]
MQVVTKYQFTCALTGYRCLTADGAAIVDAAHIEPWAKGQNDDPQNGLALCKNAHWAFDEGLWSVSDDWRILVSSYRLSETGPESLKLAPYGGRLLQFAEGTSPGSPGHFPYGGIALSLRHAPQNGLLPRPPPASRTGRIDRPVSTPSPTNSLSVISRADPKRERGLTPKENAP